ncbi:hypothetical protein TIFTF001_003625 [Ficus carica]|uniref:Cytochrome P450 n=1 Tax=Ficus carica TaxID=3494 RepID=A0AA88CRS0_FICCA|nr:hypothetical protein TIFTF001_003625 [Ficus carica]
MEILMTQDDLLSGRYVSHVSPTKSSILSSLSVSWRSECNESWKYLRSELLTTGTDTSSSTIEYWTMTELIKNPKCMKIAQEELAREIVQDVVTESHLPKLSYLQACVKETLRLHPPVPFLLLHQAVESCQVLNYPIPKDSKVLVNIWAIGRDPTYWNDPLVFKPERFLELSLDFKGNDFEYLPFGA